MIKLVAILNITPDSFSDGGKFNNLESAINQTNQLIKNGADVIDIGAESTRPGATPLSHIEEWKRLKDILPEVIKMSHENTIEVSLDSRHYQNIQKALDLGIDIINDVTGFDNKDMVRLAAASDKKLIVMHSLGAPARKDVIIDENLDEIEEVKNWMQSKINYLINFGVKEENIIFDPGVGFGKNSKQSFNIINNIESFKDLGVKIYVGHSRKRFLDLVEFDGDRDQKTLEVSKSLIEKRVDYLRVHDVKSHMDLMKSM